MGYRIYIKTRKTKAGQPGVWPENKRIEAVTTYLTTGNWRLTESITGIPEITLKSWANKPWWKEYKADIQSQETIVLDKKLEKVMDKALDSVMDRLENGEFIYDEKTGKVKRVPPKLRDTNKVLTDMIDKRSLIKKINKAPEENKQITADHLVQLAQAFAQFTTGKKPEEKIANVYEGQAKELFDQLELSTGCISEKDSQYEEVQGAEAP